MRVQLYVDDADYPVFRDWVFEKGLHRHLSYRGFGKGILDIFHYELWTEDPDIALWAKMRWG